jgi:hypothetical protein
VKGPAVVLLLALSAIARPSFAAPSLREDALATEKLSESQQLDVVAHTTSFLEEGHVLAVASAPAAGSSAAHAPRCRTLVLISARTVMFTAIAGSNTEDSDELLAIFGDKDSPRRKLSDAGLLVMSACGDAADGLERVFVRMESPRGSLEALAVAGERPLEKVDAELGRVAGPSAPRGDPGPPLSVGPLPVRRDAAEQRARADGATNVLLLEAKAGATGTGDISIKVPVGCHRFDVMAEAPEGQSGLDLDAELRDADTGQKLGRDRGEAPDARVEACVGRTTELSLVFAGAAPGGRVVVHDALFPLPEGVPSHWGPRAVAGMVSALRKRLRRGPERSPVFEALGAQGSTKMSLPVEPGRCYVAAVTLLRGSSRGMRLIASASARAAFEEVPPTEDGASVVFCANRSRADLTLDLPGASVGWLLSVWTSGVSPPPAKPNAGQGPE